VTIQVCYLSRVIEVIKRMNFLTSPVLIMSSFLNELLEKNNGSLQTFFATGVNAAAK